MYWHFIFDIYLPFHPATFLGDNSLFLAPFVGEGSGGIERSDLLPKNHGTDTKQIRT